MKTKGFCIGIIFLVLLVCTTCTKDDPLLTPDGEPFALKSAVSASDFDFSESVTLFGPMKIERTKSKPVTVVKKIHIENYDCFEINFMVEIRSGDLHGNNCVSSGIVIINDEAVLSQKDFKNKAQYFDIPMELPENFNIEVRLNGNPGDFLTITIFGIMTCDQCGGTFIDERDGQEYRTVKIGDQCWMAENLRANKYDDGTAIPLATQPVEWANLSSNGKAFCWYGYMENLDNNYGALYNWEAAMNGASSSDENPSGVQGVCPSGWHLPSDEEWKIMEMSLGMSRADADKEDDRGTDEAGKLKEAGTEHWASPNVGATNASGFTALPASQVHGDGRLYVDNRVAFFWTATKHPQWGGVGAYDRYFWNYDQQVRRDADQIDMGFSIRCVKD